MTDKISKWKKFQPFALALIVALIIGNAIGTAYIWKRHQATTIKDTQTIAFLQNVALQKELSMLKDRLSEKTVLLNQVQESLRQCQMQISKKPHEWMLMQADYLIQLAAFNLMYENNIPLAHQLLQAADRTIQHIDSASILPLRQALAQDIEMLRTSPTLDISNVMGHLNTVSQQVEQLPATISTAPTHEKTPNVIPGSNVNLFNRFVVSVKNILMDTVIVKKDTTLPLLNINQYTFIVTDIQSQLSLSSWAVINQKPVIYHQSLEKVDALVRRYFPNNSPVVKEILKNIQDLQTVTINPSAPEIAHTLKAIQEAQQ